jgi:hypothetical protein
VLRRPAHIHDGLNPSDAHFLRRQPSPQMKRDVPAFCPFPQTGIADALQFAAGDVLESLPLNPERTRNRGVPDWSAKSSVESLIAAVDGQHNAEQAAGTDAPEPRMHRFGGEATVMR